MFKPVLDRAMAFFAIIAALPLMIILAAAVRASSPGPAIFRQERVGFRGRPFTMYKYRTMYEGAEKDKARLSHLDVADGPAFKIPDDPRLTWLGKILSRTFLDELPQLYNILRGDMSFVGPRPPTPDEVPKYEDWQKRRLEAKPGLTSPWVIRGRHRLSFDEWMRSDIEYVDGVNIITDAGVVLGTLAITLKEIARAMRDMVIG
ncbi:MAG: sugar transferase [Candidatus Altiarchaeota archaeon]